MKKKRFTLIELLIVIAIIAILASLLLPALGRARKQSKEVVCRSNLKQIGFAVVMYSDDNQGYMPTANIGNSAPFSPGTVYYTANYLDIVMDSANPLNTDLRGTIYDEPVLEGPVKGGIQFAVSAGYGWNWRYMGYKTSSGTNEFGPQKWHTIINPSFSMLAGDTSDTTSIGGNKYFRFNNVGNRHGKGDVNALFGDGHVNLVRRVLITTNSEMWWYSDSQ